MRGPKQKVVLQRYKDVSDGMGGYTRTWEDILELKGVLYMLAGRELIMYEKLTEDISHRILIKSISGLSITTKDRFRQIDSGRIFEIKFVDPPEKRRDWSNILLREYVT